MILASNDNQEKPSKALVMSCVRKVHPDTFWFEIIRHFAPVINDTD